MDLMNGSGASHENVYPPPVGRCIGLLVILIFLLDYQGFSQPQVPENFLRIDARGDAPLFTTYAATMERSRLYGDKAYKMDYYSGNHTVAYSSDQAGDMFTVWKIDKVVIMNLDEFFSKPLVRFSFPDMVILTYEPFSGIEVTETFLVYSSKIALVDMWVQNTSLLPHEVEVYPLVLTGNDSIHVESFDISANAYITGRYESPKRLISNLKTEYGYPTHVRDILMMNRPVYSYGGYQGDFSGFYNIIKTDFYSTNRNDSLNLIEDGFSRYISLHQKVRLSAGEQVNIRYLRGIQDQKESTDDLVREMVALQSASLQPFADENVRLFSRIPRIQFQTADEKLVYLGAFNLVRGCMYPPAGKTSFNSYAFSRQPLWGWGHGHQVLHESLSMLAYAYLDPVSAQNSQRIYMEQQGDDGLIAYRHGPRGPQTYPHQGKPTTSAPFYSWINWEIYQVSRDQSFLSDAYLSGVKYTRWLFANRDVDQDSTFEWGPYGIIENVRDWYNAVFQVSAERYLDVDKEDISDELECLDLTLMVIKEMRSLSSMATELGFQQEAIAWKNQAENISRLVNERMWEARDSFFYSVNRQDHRFFFMTRDLRRQEIIGFLPLWAEAVTPERAHQLIPTLTDTTRFWRKYGIPTLSARDEWYSPYVDYCCKWNGPVWLLWDYMIFHGLKNYGYDDLAKQLADKMVLCVTNQLKKNHNFWESYSPDNDVLNCPSNYIWDAIMARLLIDVYLPNQ